MNSVLSPCALFAQLKRLLLIWLALAVLVAAFEVADRYRGQTGGGVATALVSYSYDGIESGKDPLGNRFDTTKMKDDAVIRAATVEAGLAVDDEGIERIKSCLSVSGNASTAMLRQITNYASAFKSEEAFQTASVPGNSYFPTQYTLTFRYADAGFDYAQGMALFDAILSQYTQSFYALYGYNASFERSMEALKYEDFDYAKAVDVLDANLGLLEGYLEHLSEGDSTRFTAEATGLSFADLLDAVNTMRNNDLFRVSSYIASNNVTKSRLEQIDYYEYRVKTLERDRAALQERLATLDELIGNYAKTQAVVAGIVGENTETSETGETTTTGVMVTQHSATYDMLVEERINGRVELSELQEEIAYCGSRVESLRGAGSKGSSSMAEEMLKAANEKLVHLTEATRETAQEYFETVRLDRAVRTEQLTDGAEQPLASIVKSAKSDIVTAEIFLFGLYLLCATILALLPQELLRRPTRKRADAQWHSTASGANG